jgi:hypothetical protein
MDEVLMSLGLRLSRRQVFAVGDCPEFFEYIDMHKHESPRLIPKDAALDNQLIVNT